MLGEAVRLGVAVAPLKGAGITLHAPSRVKIQIAERNFFRFMFFL
jgi:hypothetical protein